MPSAAARRSPPTRWRCCAPRDARLIGRGTRRHESPLRAESDRPAARRQRAHRALQLAARARPRRHVHPAHRGHRRRALDDASPRTSILEDLRWLGLDWDEGPDVGGAARPVPPVRAAAPLHVVRQRAAGRRPRLLLLLLAAEARGRSPRGARRRAAAAIRRHAAASIPPDEARGAHRRRRARRSIRFRVPEHVDVAFQDLVRGEVTFSTDVIGDPVLVRSDGRPAYNFAVVVDDALMEITHVIRGEDHISNTPRQVLLYGRSGSRRRAFAHCRWCSGPDHTPLSKRHGATSVAEFRERGYLPEALTNYLALIGWSPPGGGETDERADADRRAGAALRARGRRPQRRRVRSREAGVDEPALHEGGGAGAAGRGERALSSRRAAS